MRKLGVVLVIAAALILLGLPAVLGMLTESQVNARVASLRESDVWSVEIRSYERGWFSSRAVLELGLSPDYLARIGALRAPAGDSLPAAELLGSRAPVAVEFAHGPIAVLDGVHFGLSKMVARPDPQAPRVVHWQQQLGIPYLFEFRGRTAFSGAVAFDADMPSIDLPVEDVARLQFSGAFLDGTLQGNRLVADASIDSLAFSSPTGTFAVENVRAATDSEVRSEYLMPGTARLSVERISIIDALGGNVPAFEARNLSAGTDVTVDAAGALLDVEAVYAADSVAAADMELADASLTLSLRNIDVAALEAYFDTLQDLAASGPTLAPEQALARLTPAIERGLAAGPSLTIEPLEFRLDDEPLEARFELRTNTAALPPAGALDLQDPGLWMALLDSRAELDVSKVLAQRLATLAMRMQMAGDPSIPPQQAEYMAEAQAGLILVTLVAQGVLTDTGDAYRAELRFADGALALNGRPLPFGLP